MEYNIFRTNSLQLSDKVKKSNGSGYQSILSPQHRTLMMNGCIDFIVADLRPLNAIEGDGLRSLLSSFSIVHASHQSLDLEEVSYFLPHRNTVQHHIGQRANKIRNKIKSELQFVFGPYGSGGAIALDLWTDSYRQISYLGMIAHYINEKFEMCGRLIACKGIDSSKEKNGDLVLAVIKKELAKYGLILDDMKKKIVFATDRGSNMIKALQSYNHITCLLHFLSNSVKKIFCGGRTQFVLITCKAIVAYIKRSGRNDQFNPSLKSTSDVRWNYAIVMMKSMITGDNWSKILSILEENNKTHLMCDVIQDEILSLIEFLEIFHLATKAMETTSKPTIFCVLAWFEKIEKCIRPSPADSLIVQTAKTNMESYFLLTLMENKEFLRSKYHNMSVFLHPAMKNMMKFSPAEKEEIMKEVCYCSIEVIFSEKPPCI